MNKQINKKINKIKMGTSCWVCYKQEKILNTNPISRQTNRIIDNQLEKYLCQVYDSKENKGSGFVCKIPFPDEFHLLPVLITNNHVLNEDELANKKIKISFDDDKIIKIINIFPDRKIYTSINYDTTIIEIIPEKDDIKYFLDVEINSDQLNDKEQIYILQYPNGINCSVSYGYIHDINDFNIAHKCSTENGSSGGPIILLNTFKVIGVHKGSSKFNFNLGTLLKYPVLDFNKNITNTKRKFLIPVLGINGSGKTTLIKSILKIESSEESNNEEIRMYENEKVLPNFSFLDKIGFSFYYNYYEILEENDSKIINFIKKKFNANKPDNYIDCFWFCIRGHRIENVIVDVIKSITKKYSEIPLILIYTYSLNNYIIKQIIEYFKSKGIDNDIIPVLAKESLLHYGKIIMSHGIDDLLKKTIEKCENRRKNIKHY